MTEVWGIAYDRSAIKNITDFDEYIGRDKEWSTKKLAEKTLSYLRANKIPFIFKVFKDTADTNLAKEDLITIRRTGKLKEAIISVYVIPDLEEDPAADQSFELTGPLIVAGMLAAIPTVWIVATLGLNGWELKL